jgi:hypothetical protein
MLDAAIRAGVNNWFQKHGDNNKTTDPSTGLTSTKWKWIQSSSEILENKTAKDIYKHWNDSLNPSIRRGKFTKDEG